MIARHRRIVPAVLALLGLVALLVWPSDARAQAGDEASSELAGTSATAALAALEAGETIEVIVSRTSMRGLGLDEDHLDQAGQAQVVPGIAVEVIEEFDFIDAVAVQVTSVEQLEALAAHPGVDGITFGDEQAVRWLDESRALTGVDASHTAGVLGAGVTIAVIDGGIDADHPDFTGAITYEACFVRNRLTDIGFCPGGATEAFGPGSAPDDTQSHGTLVAGVAVSRGAVAPVGIAPAADLEVYKLFEENEGGYLSDLIRTLEFIADNRPDVDVVNLSFGYTPDATGICDADYPALFDAIQVLRDRGVVAVAATGNQGLATMGAPACLTNVVSVGASGDTVENREEILSFSNVSPVIDLVAPGGAVETSLDGGTSLVVSGTSFSSPHVAGCAALVRESGLFTATAIEDRLRASASMAAIPDGGPSVALVDCSVGLRPTGNVNCDARTDVIDGLVIAQFVVGNRSDSEGCPIADDGTEINAAEGDLNGDAQVDIVDALVVTQCVVGLDNEYC